MNAILYATKADMVASFGSDELDSLLEGDPAVQDASIDRAVLDASEEADSYITMVYTPPFPNIPRPLTSAVCDIARFRLYKDRPTENVKYRYEQAIKWLLLVSTAKARLTFDPLPEEPVLVVPLEPAAISGQARCGVFSDAVFALQPTVSEFVTYTRRRAMGSDW